MFIFDGERFDIIEERLGNLICWIRLSSLIVIPIPAWLNYETANKEICLFFVISLNLFFRVTNQGRSPRQPPKFSAGNSHERHKKR